MSEIITFSIDETEPSLASVLENQGIVLADSPSQKIITILDRAIQLYKIYAEPRAIFSEITLQEFDNIYRGEGLNEKDTPIEKIYVKADNLALLAVTIGRATCIKIEELFQRNDFALASMLDSVASAATDKLAELMERYYFKLLLKQKTISSSLKALRYSPGYCGWHISAQKKLFAFLHPKSIGITLRESFIMEPLKSITGVIIAGPRNIHIIDQKYDFCKECKSPTCIDRGLLSL
ncbi:MAG: hypothetical protein A2Y62_20125 [Candidatus Fischerbacteria bacterium RBG_13_37_8]|uniref:AdoMet activation domain-containing protein n=1 Tax=Candidatus Fischerbacteria bacterium RBG_13_37_8 TaxID=1817863 RepID=A0A1F5VTJ0_9BACT|nr:MAG: hypothetical protein A2Y62_20125 [Candidatus Fischerbacteria bacterium RBG_13_37_8]